MGDSQLSFASIVGTFLKRYYGKGSIAIKEQQNLKARFYDHLKRSDEKPTGDGFFFPVNVEGNESGRASNENESFADPQSVSDVQFQINAKHTYWPFQLTGFSMEVATSNADSFARTQQRQMRDNVSRMMSDLNRQYWGVGTGQMTLVNGAVSASTSIICDDVIYFRTNMRIDIWNSIGGTRQATNVRITNINSTTNTITVDQAVTVSDNAIIVKTGVLDNAPSDYKEIFGAQAIVDTTTYNTSIQGQSKSTYPVLQATVIDAGGVSVTNALLQQLETGIENASEMDVMEKWSNRKQRDKYIELLVPLKRFQNDDAMDSGKRKPVEHNGLPWYVDKDCPSGHVFAFTKGSIQKFVITEPDIEDRDGSVISRLPGSDVYQGYYKSHQNAGTYQPNGNGKIINLATT